LIQIRFSYIGKTVLGGFTEYHIINIFKNETSYV